MSDNELEKNKNLKNNSDNETEIDKDLDFEKALEKLKKIVGDLEKGGLSLEKTLTEFNKAMQLLKLCHQKLDGAEKKINLMIKENDEFTKEASFETEMGDE